MYYKIIPLTRLPLNRDQFFTYQYPEKIPFGSLVMIPLGNKQLKGVVLESTKRPPFSTKKVIRVLSPAQLTQKQLALAEAISEYYLTSLGVVLKSFLWPLTKKERAIKMEPVFPQQKPIETKDQAVAIKKINSSFKPILLFGPASSGKTEVAMATVAQTIEEKKQALLLIPEIFLAYQEINRWSNRFKQFNIALFHSKLTAGEKTCIYNQVKIGQIHLVISTRLGLFLPFKKLGRIVVDEEQDLSHKNWDQNPHYHTRQVSQLLAEQHRAKLLFLSSAPSFESINSTKNRKIQLVKIPALKNEKLSIKPPAIEIVGLEKYFKKFGQPIISTELKSALTETLKKKQLAFIFVPSRGKSRLVLCSDCRQTLRCPSCHSALIHSGNYYRCLHCRHKISALSQCPHCQSFRLIDIGYGTAGIAEKLKFLWPQAHVALADADAFNQEKNRRKIFRDLTNGKIDILIGTYAIAKGLDFKKCRLTAVLDADSWAGQIDYKFDERWLGNLFQLAGRVNRPGSDQKGICLIQTHRPNHPQYQLLKKWDWLAFAQKEIAERKKLHYPPTWKLIKLTNRNQCKQKVEKSVEKIYNALETEKSSRIIVDQPYFGAGTKKRGFYLKHLLIRHSNLKTPAKIAKIINRLGPDWNIDVDPEIVY